MADRSYLSQRFAKISLGAYTLIGYSVAGEETVCQIPELGVCFDIGRAPLFCLNSPYVCLSHGHMDHAAGLAYYVSQRHFQGMKPGTILVHETLRPAVEGLLKAWRELERPTPYRVVSMRPGEDFAVRRDFLIRPVATRHSPGSLAYVLVSVREKLKPEFHGKSAAELVAIKNSGVEIQYRLEVPLVAFTGDTSAGEVFDHPDIQNAALLITECTFFDREHVSRAKEGKHLHIQHFLALLPKLKNQRIILTHVTRRTGIPRARRALTRALGEDALKRIGFLMDFEGAADAGAVEDVVEAGDSAD